jgi:hypothetical protein
VSKTSFASRFGVPPEFFIDRSLGRHAVPAALREAGLTVHTMADVYGERVGQRLDDEEWLRAAGQRGWAVLMTDAKIRYRPTAPDFEPADRRAATDGRIETLHVDVPGVGGQGLGAWVARRAWLRSPRPVTAHVGWDLGTSWRW